MERSDHEMYEELCYYSLAHPDPAFIHQHVVDAHTAQQADASTKAIGLIFSLAGLYLYLEKGYTGKQVQHAHTRMAGNKQPWQAPGLPEHRGSITVADVLNAKPGEERDTMIKEWCASVWHAFKDSHRLIIAITEESVK